MDFSPIRKKVVVSITVMVVLYVIAYFFINSLCAYVDIQCPPEGCCIDCQINTNLYPDCICSCTTYAGLFIQLIIFFLPGVITYILWSLFQKK
jgi:hypothetical protein